MPIRTLVRWCGVALLIGGMLGAVGEAVQPLNTASSAALSPAWIPVHTLFLAADVFIAFGLFGLYLRQADKAGWLGLIAFVLAVFATALSIGSAAIQAYVFSYVAAQPNAPKLLSEFTSPGGPLAAVGPLDLTWVLLYEPGFILTAIATIRAGVLPRWAGWLLLASSVLANLVFLGGRAELVGLWIHIVFGLSLAALGYAVWANPGQAVEIKAAPNTQP
ncbi:MAG: hypothetical protein WCF84_00770 [Anaerolineae bacterium]